MYNLYTDKPEKFKCKIELEGASVAKSNVRLVLESNNVNLLFKGTIDSAGLCEINISKLKDLISESTTGKLKLEVIADGDAYFCPWESDFQVLTSKKVTVEVLEKQSTVIKENSKPSVKVSDITQINHKPNPLNSFVKLLKEYNINKQDLSINNRTLLPVLEQYRRDIKSPDSLTVFINKLRESY
jgi:hypothetical protein